MGTGTESMLPAVTVPRTLSGVATAISTFGAAHRTPSPRRSHPASRDHPPLVSFGERRIPRGVRDAISDTGIEFRVPPSLAHLLVAAPLAYYLGADVRVGPGQPRLRAADAGFERRFRRLPEFESAVADLLRRVVYLDSLLRHPENAPRDRTELGIDPSVRERPPAGRLASYAALPAAAVRSRLPNWHLSTYIEPRIENVPALPYVLDRLSLVYLPRADELEPRRLLERTLEDFYRGSVASVDVLDPELGAGVNHAWLADGTPIDAFKASRRAYENRFTGATPADRVRVAVVCNDPEMTDERRVADVYRGDSGGSVDVSVHDRLGRRELAGLFEDRYALVHYIGHCEADGLECPDGFLSASELDRCRARAFFLNACGSYHEGRTLVDRGSVAGAVTLARVLDDQAGTVGLAVAGLLVRGFDVATAVRLASRRVMMGKDYAVVGDGTFAPTPRSGHPAVLGVERAGGEFSVTYDVEGAGEGGRYYRDPFDGSRRPHGSTARTSLDRSELVTFLEGRPVPVRYDGDLRWASSLATEFKT